jgi:serine phosphatase RsbU (regulator of sigma subunit)
MEMDEHESLRSKAQLLLQRERELFDLRAKHEELAVWLGIGQLLPQVLFVGALEDVWGRIRKVLISKLRLQRVLLLEVNEETLLPLAPAGDRFPFPSDARLMLATRPWGLCNDPSLESNLLGAAALAEALGMHRFVWSSIARKGRPPVLLAGGFERAKAGFHSPFVEHDAAHFNNLAQQMESMLANALLVGELKQEKDQLRQANLTIEERNRELQELDVARRIQTSLLPHCTHGLHAELDIAAKMLPADEVGGDYYDAALDGDGVLWLTIGDVSGHGLIPGLVMMMAQTAHSVIRLGCTVAPSKMVARMNCTLYDNIVERLRSNLYMTFVALRYEGSGCFVYAGLHIDLLVHRQRTDEIEQLSTQGMWLGIEADIANTTVDARLQLEIGDTLVLCTDGLHEALSPSGQMLDIAGMRRLARKHAHLPTTAMAEAILKDAREWCADHRRDDMTVMVVRRIK